ncbi:MAG: cytochrome c oxidase subunit, partial [Actinomycetota bacterium]
MTTYATRPIADEARPSTPAPTSKGKLAVKLLTSTDHKTIGYLYLGTSFVWFLIGGILALLIRAELTRPGMQFLSSEQYNQVFT